MLPLGPEVGAETTNAANRRRSVLKNSMVVNNDYFLSRIFSERTMSKNSQVERKRVNKRQ
jgi:hypothetical protein